MLYTVRFAHMKNEPLQKVGDKINIGDVVGIMGNTGTGTGAHLHIDCVEGEIKKHFTLNDMTNNKPRPNKRQLDFFIDGDLFMHNLYVTTQYNDKQYYDEYKKWHSAYDVVPQDRLITDKHFAIHWNRTKEGTVVRVEKNDPGYGNCLYVSFDA